MDHKNKHTNLLINENSPYLLQHAHNPVNWYPWGNEAMEIAKEKDKLLLISVGYSACHWCHVMEEESFINEEIANIMNENFVCIKVDREEHPDVDQIYMTAVQMITGSGGWPLNCFALPDGRPVYGGTYFKPDQWKHVLKSLSLEYQSDKNKFVQAAQQLESGISQSELNIYDTAFKSFEFEGIENAVEKQKNKFDYVDGGFNRAPKFPLPSFWHFLLEYAYYSKDKKIMEHLKLTLDKMATGGIYDQLAGGFARYSVDSYWKVPHFEKMLYDNAQLVSLYSYAYQYLKKTLYKNIVIQTLEFTANEMTSEEFGFYSSFDADSDGEEGKFYVWKKNEIEELLGDDAELFCEYYSVSSVGNWENGKNILHSDNIQDEILKKYELTEIQLDRTLKQTSQILLEERAKRKKPGLDDKVLTSWNAMMVNALIDAYIVFNMPDYLKRAEKSMQFLFDKMLVANSELFRSYKNGNVKIKAYLDDYAFMIQACIKLFQVTGKQIYAEKAKRMTDYVIKHFYDKQTGMFFYVSDIEFNLIVRTKELSDNVIPSSNSVMAKNLDKLGLIYSNPDYIKKAKTMVEKIYDNSLKNIEYFGNWASLALKYTHQQFEFVIIGEDFQKLADKHIDYRPDVFTCLSKEKSELSIFEDRYVQNKTLIYVCKNNICNLPDEDINKALEKLKTD